MQGLCIALLLIITFSINAAEIRVATAANFYQTLNKIKLAFEKNSEHTVTIIRGSTGKLYAQIIHGAPYDLFLSADSQRAEKLVEAGKSLDSEAIVYATGRLVLWRPDADSSQQIKEELTSGLFKKFAIANPKNAPYGRAAIEMLREMELYEESRNKIVYAENIAQAVQFVQSGAADLGLVARSLVNHDIYWEVEDHMHSPIEQKMIILRQARDKSAALSFYKFIQSEEAKQIIRADGYKI